ncbi:class I SAM-dependent methyltransferase [Amycolatopsis sp. NPDC051102]|uniref:class I SAM-dependent methyltransferase n=1 Tax=Amycolatopsis sp. NPDC051102 TaxID=3155163 RepID=UPI003438766A
MISTRLAIRALRLAVTRASSNPIRDYDAASQDYDSFFTRVMGKHSADALELVKIVPGDVVVELACGTGHLTTRIQERLDSRGTILAVDKSPGMLAVAREKVTPRPGLTVDLQVGDMTEFLRALPDASADIVICGWAICYAKPVQLLKQIHRVLRPGGQVLVVETRADALRTLVESLEQVFAQDPSVMTALIRVNLPKNADVVARWFTRAGLSVSRREEGEQLLPVHSPDEALEYVQRSGAAAGFKDAVDASREAEVLAKLRTALAERAGELTLRHTYVVVSGRKLGPRW